MNTDDQKDQAGKALITRFGNLDPDKLSTIEQHERWQDFVDYCYQDVVGMRELYKKLKTHNHTPLERFIYLHTCKMNEHCLLYTSPSPRDRTRSRMPSSA